MQDKQIITALLAYGMSGKLFHAPFIQAHKGFILKGIVERNKKIAQANYPNIISYNSIEQVLADTEIDLVIVNTPSYTHYEYAKQALIAGKHVLVEKPFVATAKQAKELFLCANTVGKKILVYQNRRYDSGFNAVKQIIESKQLGKLVEIHFRFDRYRNEIGPKAFKEEPVPASGIAYDLGAHLLDQAISLFGKPEHYYKTLGKNRLDTQVDDYFHVQLKYANDLNVFLTASFLVAEILPAFVVNGTKGSYHKNHADVQERQLLQGIKPTDVSYGVENPADKGKLTLVINKEIEVQYPTSPKGNYMAIFEAAYQTIVHQIPFPVKEEEIIWQLKILEE